VSQLIIVFIHQILESATSFVRQQYLGCREYACLESGMSLRIQLHYGNLLQHLSRLDLPLEMNNYYIANHQPETCFDINRYYAMRPI
jgi:hypothetical protein